MKIFVDDVRMAPDETYTTCRDYDDACATISFFKEYLELVDLDYDLGYSSSGNGMDILKYMKENNIKPKNFKIHTGSAVGRGLMLDYIKGFFPESKII